MLTITPARLRGRPRRALLAAALPAAVAAAALPNAAEAGTANVINASANGVVGYSAAAGETNNVVVRVENGKVVIADSAPITARDGCTLNGQGDAECPISVDAISMVLGDRNDTLQYRAPHAGGVGGDAGQDMFFGALRQAVPGRSIQPFSYNGGTGSDTMNYVLADRGVRVDTADGRAEDGRPGIDRETIDDDIEIIDGSNFGDTLLGSDRNDLLRGLNGDDALGGRGGADVFDEGSAADGSDGISGGDGANDRVFYSLRTGGVRVSLDGVRNDGAIGEQDNVVADVEHIGGTNFGDVLTGSGLANVIDGFGGADTIDGLGGNDTLSAGTGNNRVSGGTGNDVIFALNRQVDDIDCGENANDSDTADRDTIETSVLGCERGQVGALRLTPKVLHAEAGETARVKLSWRHPQAWRKLRKVELRLLAQHGIPVGEITIRPRTGRTGADGAVKLVRNASRLSHEGNTVTARLALRLDPALAGQTLKAEVEATDGRGRRQLERDAATVRVAR